MGADVIGKTIHPHPTLCESIGMAAEAAPTCSRRGKNNVRAFSPAFRYHPPIMDMKGEPT
jgi:hypothetical protein